jgi:hypothetical protein
MFSVVWRRNDLGRSLESRLRERRHRRKKSLRGASQKSLQNKGSNQNRDINVIAIDASMLLAREPWQKTPNRFCLMSFAAVFSIIPSLTWNLNFLCAHCGSSATLIAHKSMMCWPPAASSCTFRSLPFARFIVLFLHIVLELSRPLAAVLATDYDSFCLLYCAALFCCCFLVFVSVLASVL